MSRSIHHLLYAAAICSILSFTTCAQARHYPDKQIYIVVGVSPGGGTDSTTRLLAKALADEWHQTIIVENKEGAAGAIANEFVAKSKPDGYTLLAASNDITALSAYKPDLAYDLLRDFTPISLASKWPEALVVRNSLGVHNVKELIALAKSKPGVLTYSSPGVGSQTNLQMVRFANVAGIKLLHVPYKGASAAVQAIAQGDVDMTFGSPASMLGLVKAGKVTMLGIGDAQRNPLLPSIPTIAEAGGPKFVYSGWGGLFAPKGVPADVANTINSAIRKANLTKDLQKHLANVGLEAASSPSPSSFRTFVQNDLREATKMVELAGLKSK